MISFVIFNEKLYYIIYIYIYIYSIVTSYIYIFRSIGQVVRVFANGPGDQVSIPGQVIPKIQKMVLDTALLNTQHYKVRIKGKVEQTREWSSPLPYIAQSAGVVEYTDCFSAEG